MIFLCSKLHHSLRQDEASNAGVFDHLIKSITDEHERTLVNFLNAEHRRLRRQQQITSATRYFDTLYHLVSFIAGLVKYLPKVLLNQMLEKNDIPWPRHRLAAISLLHLLVAEFYPAPRRGLYLATFFTATEGASEFSPMVFKAYRRGATDDSSPLIRGSYLELVEQLLNDTQDQGQAAPCWLLHAFARLLHVDPSNELRLRALTILNDLFSGSEGDTTADAVSESLLNEKLLSRLALAAQNAEERHPVVQQLAMIVTTKAYLSLMMATTADAGHHHLPRLDCLGRLAGILLQLYPRSAGQTRAMLKNFLRLIGLFLREQKAGKGYPAKRYLEHPLMKHITLT